MQVVYRRCCGLDVHKNSITACVLVLGDKGQREARIKEFGTSLKSWSACVCGYSPAKWRPWPWNRPVCIGRMPGAPLKVGNPGNHRLRNASLLGNRVV
jgi:hypothetical protein